MLVIATQRQVILTIEAWKFAFKIDRKVTCTDDRIEFGNIRTCLDTAVSVGAVDENIAVCR